MLIFKAKSASNDPWIPCGGKGDSVALAHMRFNADRVLRITSEAWEKPLPHQTSTQIPIDHVRKIQAKDIHP